METANVNMTVHSVFYPVTIQKSTKLPYVVREVFWRYGCIFNESNGFSFAREVSEKSHPFFAKIPEFRDFTSFVGDEEAMRFSGSVSFFKDFLTNGMDLFFQFRDFIPRELDQVDGAGRSTSGSSTHFWTLG
jgi:hypothetical protein